MNTIKMREIRQQNSGFEKTTGELRIVGFMTDTKNP